MGSDCSPFLGLPARLLAQFAGDGLEVATQAKEVEVGLGEGVHGHIRREPNRPPDGIECRVDVSLLK